MKGFRCYLGRKSYINYLIKNLKEYIYIDKGYHNGVSEGIYETIKQNEGIIVNLDEEGAIDFSSSSILMGRYSKTLFNYADLTFMWGNKQYELVKNNMNKKNKVEVTGHPRFELLKPEFHYLYQDEVDKIKKKYQNFFLINTNMGYGNNIKGDEFIESNYGDRFRHIKKIISFDKKKLEAYRLLVMELSKHFNKTIVLRPHPEENHSPYLQAFKGMKNIHVINEGSSIHWILAADLIIHPDCTTAIESLFVGKKPVSYLPNNYPKDLVANLPLEASVCFTSKSELILFIKNKMDSLGNVILGNYPFAEDYFTISQSTTKLVVDKIDQLCGKRPINQFKGINFNDLVYLKLSYLKNNLFFKNNSSQLSYQKSLGFNSKNVREKNKTIRNHSNQFSAVRCKAINNNLFLYKYQN